jgi:hypothetical protein
MKGDVRNAAPEMQQAHDCATDNKKTLGFSLKKIKVE